MTENRVPQDTLVDIPEIAARLLARRGIEYADMLEFLHPSLRQLPDPLGLKDMEKAAAILIEAVQQKRPVSVYGDYDVDGVTAVALLVHFFREIGHNKVYWFVPSRLDDGYGVAESGLLDLLRQHQEADAGDAGVLVTVDCGISDHQGIARAKELGFTVIVTDHHRPAQDLPDADAVINPLQPGCNFPCKHLAGVGVAFYLAAGLRRQLDQVAWWRRTKKMRPNLRNFLDLVSLGTIADSMQLTGVNRILVAAGLEVLSRAPRLGIKSLYARANISPSFVLAEDVAFRLAPRLNAAGRTGRQELAVEILLAEDSATADMLAEKLEEANNIRKSQEKEIMQEVQAEANFQVQSAKKVIVVSGDWNPGLIGIVASRLSGGHARPSVVFTTQTKDKDSWRGSGRACNGVDFLELLGGLQQRHGILERFGGHKQAVGLEIGKDNYSLFKEALEKMLQETDRNTVEERMLADLDVDMDDLLNADFLACYEKMMPFGAGNKEPVFISAGIMVESVRKVGDGHVRISVRTNSNKRLNGIGFRMPDIFRVLTESKTVTLVYHIKKNRFLKRGDWEIQVLEAKCNFV